MLKAIRIIANSRKRPLVVFIPASNEWGNEAILPKRIPNIKAKRMVFILTKSPRNIAPVAIASVRITPLNLLVNVEELKIYCFSSP